MSSASARLHDTLSVFLWTFNSSVGPGQLVSCLQPILRDARARLEMWSGGEREAKRPAAFHQIAKRLQGSVMNRALIHVEPASIGFAQALSRAAVMIVEVEVSPLQDAWLNLRQRNPRTRLEALRLAEANRQLAAMAWNELTDYPVSVEIRAQFRGGIPQLSSEFWRQLAGSTGREEGSAELLVFVEATAGVADFALDRWGRGCGLPLLRQRFPGLGQGWVVPEADWESINASQLPSGITVIGGEPGGGAALIFPEDEVAREDIVARLSRHLIDAAELGRTRPPDPARGEFRMPDGSLLMSLGRSRELHEAGMCRFLPPDSEERPLVTPRYLAELGWRASEVPCDVWERQFFEPYFEEVEGGLASLGRQASRGEIIRSHVQVLARYIGSERAHAVGLVLEALPRTANGELS